MFLVSNILARFCILCFFSCWKIVKFGLEWFWRDEKEERKNEEKRNIVSWWRYSNQNDNTNSNEKKTLGDSDMRKRKKEIRREAEREEATNGDSEDTLESSPHSNPRRHSSSSLGGRIYTPHNLTGQREWNGHVRKRECVEGGGRETNREGVAPLSFSERLLRSIIEMVKEEAKRRRRRRRSWMDEAEGNKYRSSTTEQGEKYGQDVFLVREAERAREADISSACSAPSASATLPGAQPSTTNNRGPPSCVCVLGEQRSRRRSRRRRSQRVSLSAGGSQHTRRGGARFWSLEECFHFLPPNLPLVTLRNICSWSQAGRTPQ